MKRAIVVAVCLALLLPVLAVCVFASTSYSFYPFEPVALYGDSSDFFPGGEGTKYFFYEGILPAGKYEVTVIGEYEGMPIKVVCDGGPLDVGDDGLSAIVPVSAYLDGELYVSWNFGIQIFYVEDITFFVIDFREMINMDVSFFSVARFSLVEEGQSITSIVTSDLLNGIFDQIVSLVPVFFTVIVGYIAIRKGIRWLQAVLRNS